MTIQELKDLKRKVSNEQVLEAIDLAIKYRQVPDGLELIKKTKTKLAKKKIFRKEAALKTLKIEIALIDQLIKHLNE